MYMPAHYNLRSFLRQLSRELLSELFEHHTIDIDLDLSTLKQRQIDPIFADLNGAVKPLETAISMYFTEQEGRGKACQVDYLKRGFLQYFFAYPEDFPASPLAWTAQGLSPNRYRPAFEVLFVFDDTAGWLDIYCEAGKQTVQQLHSLFANTVISLRDLPEVAKPVYALEGLKRRNFPFLRPPDSPTR